jgi:hypothetical protein
LREIGDNKMVALLRSARTTACGKDAHANQQKRISLLGHEPGA